jgi:hypothetical protein
MNYMYELISVHIKHRETNTTEHIRAYTNTTKHINTNRYLKILKQAVIIK